MKKLYMFSQAVTVTEETQVEAKSYDEAVNIFLSGGGVTNEVDRYIYYLTNGADWECIDNPDELQEEEA